MHAMNAAVTSPLGLGERQRSGRGDRGGSERDVEAEPQLVAVFAPAISTSHPPQTVSDLRTRDAYRVLTLQNDR